MKLGYIAPEMTISFEEAAAQQAYMNALCAKLHPVMIDVLKSSWDRHEADMTEADKQKIDEDAKALLKNLATENPDLADLLTGKDLESMDAGDKTADDEQFFNSKASYATPVIAGLWVGLGQTDAVRRDAGIKLLADMEAGNRTPEVRNFKLMTSRFGLNKEEAGRLLTFLNDNAVAPAQSSKPSVPGSAPQP